MRRPLLVALAATSLLAATAGTAATAAAPTADTLGSKKVCATAPTGYAACHAQVRTKGAKPDATSTRSSGYISADLLKAYNLPTSATTTTVAVVDAYAHPSAEVDLDAYRAGSGLPALRQGQLQQVNQTGGTALPAGDVGWGQEEM